MKSNMRKAVVLAIAGAFPLSVWADEVQELISPNVSDVTVSVSHKTKDQTQFDQYTGKMDDGVSATAAVDYVNRSDEGLWVRVQGSDLGSRTQGASVAVEQQGNWAVGVSYDQMPRYAPNTVFTNVTGVGTENVRQGAAAAPLYEVSFKTERDITSLSASKYLYDGLKASLAFTNEDKSGVRMHSTRATSGIMMFVPEPIDLQHRQFEGALDYASKAFQVSAGFYGSFLNNGYKQLTDYTSAGALYGNYNPTALPPDNSMQQWYVKGGYNVSKDTRATFKYSHSVGRQDDAYGRTNVVTNVGLPTDLDAKIVTTEWYAGLTSRVTSDLKLSGSWRYQDRDDQTDKSFIYANVDSIPRKGNGSSQKSYWGKLDADYTLGGGYSLNGGIAYTSKKNDLWLNNEYAYGREKVSDLTTKIGVRKAMSDTANGVITLSHSDRTGSRFNDTTDHIYPTYLADRTQDKLAAMVDWSASDALNMQFSLEGFKDNYDRADWGLDDVLGRTIAADASYVINDKWSVTGWVSNLYGESNQIATGEACATIGCTAGAGRKATRWTSKLKIKADQLGIGIKGKLSGWDLVANYSYSRDLNQDDIVLLDATPAQVIAGTGVLPDTVYRVNALKLQGTYPMSKATKVRVEYLYDSRRIDDYQWATWIYNNGTYVEVKPNQVTQVIGVAFIQSF